MMLIIATSVSYKLTLNILNISTKQNCYVILLCNAVEEFTIKDLVLVIIEFLVN